MQKILFSSCLLGEKVCYDGGTRTVDNEIVQKWQAEMRIIIACPEVAGGLPTPRPAAQIKGTNGGAGVLNGKASVIKKDQSNITAAFTAGANHALALVKKHGIKIAVMKERSPSCGVTQIYDGSFSGGKINGMGVTAALLENHGVKVFSEEQISEAQAYLQKLEKTSPANKLVNNIKPL